MEDTTGARRIASVTPSRSSTAKAGPGSRRGCPWPDDRRPRPQLLQPLAHGLDDGGNPVDAPAAHPDGHAVAGTDAATRQNGIEFAVHRFVDILNPARVEMHSHPVKLRKIEIGLDKAG
jgi:hypothetical protein